MTPRGSNVHILNPTRSAGEEKNLGSSLVNLNDNKPLKINRKRKSAKAIAEMRNRAKS